MSRGSALPRIEGASAEQREILEEILAGLPKTRMRELRVKPEYDLEPERDEHNNPPPDWDPTIPLGDALWLVEPPHPDLRTEWELEMVGAAFHRASAEAGLAPVVAALSQNGGPYFWAGDTSPNGALPSRDEENARIQEAAAATGALLDRVEFFEPGSLAVAVTLAVPEPHGFLRHGLAAFKHLSGQHDHTRAGSFLTLVDGTSDPVYQIACRGSGCASGARRDVECCAPRGLGRGLFDPGPPPCPFPSRTWDDMYEAFRRDLSRATGHDLGEWRRLLTAAGLETDLDEVRWLEERGLGRVQAWAVVAAEA